MSCLRAFSVRLRPSRAQDVWLRQVAGCVRFVKNWALQQRYDLWQAVKDLPEVRRREAMRSGSRMAQDAQLKFLKMQFPFLAVAPANALQDAVKDVDFAFQRWFKQGAGRPRFHRRGDGDGWQEKSPKCFGWTECQVDLPKIGRIRFEDRAWRAKDGTSRIQGEGRRVAVIRDGEHWRASILVQTPVMTPPAPCGPDVGVDLGIAQAVTIVPAEGKAIVEHLPVATLPERRRMAMLQRRVSRKKRHSKNRAKAQRRFNRYRRRLSNRVKHAIHRLTTRLAKNHRQIVIEDLHVKNMSASAAGTVEDPGRNVRQKSGLNRAIQEHGWYETRRQLAYKCPWYGSLLVVVPAPHTSQRCSRCGHTTPENRPSQAVFSCVLCQHTENADVNAARNILGAGPSPVCLPRPTRDLVAGTCLNSVV